MKRIFLPLLFLFARVNDAYSCTTDCTRNSLDIVANCHAACNGTTDDTNAINCALDYVGTHGGGEVIIPPGTCIISPRHVTRQQTSADAFLHLYDNITIRGAGPKSVLKVAANTGGTGDYTSVFEAFGCPLTCPGTLSNVTIKDFRVDQNVGANPSPIPANGTHSVIYPGDDAVTVGEPTHVATTGFTVSGMVFDPTDSFNTVWLTNIGPTASLQATVTNNYFNFVRNGGPSGNYDVSTLLAEGSQQIITGNTFVTDLSYVPNCAIETLSGRNVIANNTIKNYVTGLNILPSYGACPPLSCNGQQIYTCPTSLEPNETVVANNSLICADTGMVIWPTTGTTLRNLSITGNTIDVCNADRASTMGIGQYAGIQTVWTPPNCTPPKNEARGYRGDVDGLTISNNVITMQKQDGASNPLNWPLTAGILLYQIGNLTNVLIKGNIIKDSPVSGIRVQSVSDTGTPPLPIVQRMRILDNIIVDAGNNSQAASTYRLAIGISETLKDVDIAQNMIYDTATRGAANPRWGLNALYLQPGDGSTNIRTSQNTVRVNPASGVLPLHSFQSDAPHSAGVLKDATNANDVLVSPPFTVENAVLSVDFMSFTQYITTIGNAAGALTVRSPDSNGALWAQWSVGQVVTFRFLCASTSSPACLVTFEPPYAGACEQTCLPSQPTNILIDSSKGRAITFQVEKSATDIGTHKFFELYRTPGPVTN